MQKGIVKEFYKDLNGDNLVVVKIGVQELTCYDYHLYYYFIKTEEEIINFDLDFAIRLIDHMNNNLIKIVEEGEEIISKIILFKEILDILKDDDMKERCICWGEQAHSRKSIHPIFYERYSFK
ncbi:hypothetical protein [Clostridium sp.]|uniref:hypothetical protein n=1 Tax=Clostridium sp. TaxID=1506 RepID=UPI00261C16C4|nr:hypothetical protein [Clostridium sp.]